MTPAGFARSQFLNTPELVGCLQEDLDGPEERLRRHCFGRARGLERYRPGRRIPCRAISRSRPFERIAVAQAARTSSGVCSLAVQAKADRESEEAPRSREGIKQQKVRLGQVP